MNNLFALKSGTDIRGIAVEGIEGESINLTDDVISCVVDAFAYWMCRKIGKDAESVTVSVGHDSRISAERIKKCCITTLTKRGIRVLDCALSSTPAMFMTTVDLDCDGAIQITASHHPFNRNGLKFFIRTGGLESSQLDEIISIAEKGTVLPEGDGSVRQVDYMTEYAARLRSIIRSGVASDGNDNRCPLAGYKIAVDAGNGAGGFFAEKVLAPLGADVSASRYLEPDGTFPNHIPNPENEAAMRSARNAVIESGSDLGIVFDTDVDRAAVVDNMGMEINRNRLIALASAIVLAYNPGATVVTDSVTSDGLTQFIENTLGGKHHRFKRGYRNVIDEAIRLNSKGVNAPLAIETSGHAALKDNYFLDDGAFLVTKIIILMVQLGKQGRTIGSLLSNLPEPTEAIEHRIKLPNEDFHAIGNDVLKKFENFAEEQEGWSVVKDNYEGVRVSVDKEHGDGWLLLRLSVHDPVMPLNIESNIGGGTDIMLSKVKSFADSLDNIEF